MHKIYAAPHAFKQPKNNSQFWIQNQSLNKCKAIFFKNTDIYCPVSILF